MPISYKNKIYTTLGTPTVLSGNVVSTTDSVGVPAKDYTVKGKTIVWNQLMDKSKYQETITKQGVTFTNNGDGSITVNGTADSVIYYRLDNAISVSVGHKLMIVGGISGGSWTSYLLYDDSDSAHGFDDSGVGKIYTITEPLAKLYIYINKDYTANNLVFKPQLFDLTKMFGAGNEPTTPAEFSAMFPDDYYPYNAGELKTIIPTSVEASGINMLNLVGRKEILSDTVGYRSPTDAYSEIDTYVYYKGVSPNGYLTSEKVVEATVLSSSVIVKTADNIGADGYGVGIPLTVVPSTTYYIKYTASTSGVVSIGYLNSSKMVIDYSWTISNNQFTTPGDCRYVLLVFRPNTHGTSATFENICVSTVQTNEYQPYRKYRINITSSKYFPDGMRSAGSAYDEINFLSQKATKRIGAVDMGTLNWSYEPISSHERFLASVDGIKIASGSAKGNLVCPKYATVSVDDVYLHTADKTIAVHNAVEQIWVYDTSYTDAATFKAAMSGVMLYYELVTPIETTITPSLQALSTYKGFTSFSAPNSLTQNGPLSVTYYAEGGNNPESGWLTSYKRKLYMGKNIEWNQLFDKNQFSNTKSEYGIDFTNNGDGTWTIVGTKNITQADNFYLTTVQLISDHKYFLTAGLPSDKNYKMELLQSSIQYDAWREGAIFTCAVSGEFKAYMDIYETNVEVVFKPQLFDLTQMFGAGNEPATPEEFWTYFDHKLYPYNTGETQPLFKISRKSQWGSVVSYPNKGDLITLDNKEYRVLKTNGSVAEVLAMYDSNDLFAFDNDNAIYANSGIDTYCNSTFYGALSTSMKNAIVEKTFTQDKWSLTSGTSGGTGNTIYTGIDNESNQYRIGLISTTYGTNISRKCYALSVQDVFDYLNVTTSMTAANTALNSTNIYKMFWNQTISNSDYIWLRSACYYDDVDCGFRADSDYGSLNYGDPVDSQTVRPAFQIDLSKISWTPASSSSVTPAARTITVQETSFAPAVSKLCSIRKVRGSFAGTPTLYTTANNANKIEVGNNGYEWVTKVNDDNQIVSGNDFLDAFGVSQTVDGTSLAGKTLGFMTKFSSRLSTTEGTDGGTFTSWGMSGEVEEIKSCEKEDLYCVVYNSETDTVKVYVLDEYDEQYGTFSVSAEIGYNTMIAFMLDTTEDEA